MPKKKAVPEPAPELEMEPVPAAEAAENPSAAPAGIAEDAVALPAYIVLSDKVLSRRPRRS